MPQAKQRRSECWGSHFGSAWIRSPGGKKTANRCELKERTQTWICATFRAAKNLELWAVPSYFDHFTFREMGLFNTETILLPHQEDSHFLIRQIIFWLDEAFKSEFTPQPFPVPTCWLSACPIHQQHRRAEFCKDNLKNPLTHSKKTTPKRVRFCQEVVKQIRGWGWGEVVVNVSSSLHCQNRSCQQLREGFSNKTSFCFVTT